MTVETLSILTHTPQVYHRQTMIPKNIYGTIVADDTDNHDFKVDGRGKGRLTIFVENPSNKDATLQLYGMHAIDSDVGDAGVKQIGSDITVSAGDNNYECTNDPFPFYLARVSFAAIPDSETVTVYFDFSAF